MTLHVRATHDSRRLLWRWSWHPSWNHLDGPLIIAHTRAGLVHRIAARYRCPVEVIAVDEF
jgi:hypothetical protein